jgi:hypothetical protein
VHMTFFVKTRLENAASLRAVSFHLDYEDHRVCSVVIYALQTLNTPMSAR